MTGGLTCQHWAGMTSFSLHARSEADTAKAATALAEQLRAGDVVLLDGALGAGKTTFVQSVARALGATDAVTSPTFGIAHFYETAHGRVIHVDTYRLESLAEFRDLGLDEYLPDAIGLIEWGAAVAEDFRHALHVKIETVPGGSEDERRLSFQSGSARWADSLTLMARDLGVEA